LFVRGSPVAKVISGRNEPLYNSAIMAMSTTQAEKVLLLIAPRFFMIGFA
jgi:hypothetical protein